jgi:5'-nucleotidase
MKYKKPLILVTNDDGITSPGIKVLVDAAKEFGDVCVIAPDKPQSGMGHAITVHSGIMVMPQQFEGAKTAFSCSGTPADCVKLGKYHLLKEKPDICLSGINHGANMSLNVIYSGTMSAALEGALEGIPSIGISLCNNDRDISLDAAKKVTKIILDTFLFNKPDNNLCLNVNIPDIPFSKIKGLKFCRQGEGNWQEYYEEHKNKDGEEYLWLTGKFRNFEKQSTDTDLWALDNDYVSVVPIHADMTSYKELEKVKGWDVQWGSSK